MNVTQNWIQNQKKQITAEANVRITINDNIVLDKSNLQEFSYIQNGSVTNQTLPSKEITFKVFIDDFEPFDLHSICKVEFGYFLDGDWEWNTVGYFQINEREIPQNGLIATYNANMAFYKSFDSHSQIVFLNADYNLGSNHSSTGDRGSINSLLVSSGLSDWKIDQSSNVYVGRSLQPCTKFELLQQIAFSWGKTLNLIYVDGSHYYVDCEFYDNDLSMTINSWTYFIDTNNYYEYPEFVVEEQIESISIKEYINSEEELDNLETIEVTLTNVGDFEGEHGLTGEYAFGTSYFEDPAKYFSNRGFFQNVDICENYVFAYADPSRQGETVEVELSFMKTTTEEETIKIQDIVGNTGTTLNVDNALVNYNMKDYCVNYLKRWLPNNVVIEVNFRIDPRLELFDKVVIRDKRNAQHYCICEYVEINFNGAFKGKVKAREFGYVPPTELVHKRITVTDFNDGLECAIEQMSSVSQFLNMQTNQANGMVWTRRNRETLEIIDEVDCGRVAIGQKKDPDTKEVIGNYVGVYEHTTGSSYKLLNPNPIASEFNSGNEIWTITLKAGYSLKFSRSGYERYLLDNFTGYIQK